MSISIILAHPNPQSFNHAIALEAKKALEKMGLEVIFHDLYQEKFDAILPTEEISKDTALPTLIETHCNEIKNAEGIVIVHPNWWGQPPAILKGWIDRVIRPGVAYEFIAGDSGEGVPCGLLKAKYAIVLNTSNTETLREKEVFADPLETIWKNCIFGLCGVTNFQRIMFNVIITSDTEERKLWLESVADLIEATQKF